MRVRLACLATVAAVACGGTGRISALDDGGSPDGTGPADANGATDATATATMDGAPSMEASTSACFPDGAAPDAAAPLGALCVPTSEEDSLSRGSSTEELGIETQSAACASGVCLINHFQGRVTCPDGQSASGEGPDGAPGCKAPGTCDPVTVQVLPQCSNRTAAETVYCSCRCAAAGQSDDGATYCTCPSTMMCVALYPTVPNPDGGADIQGAAYCVKSGTEYDAGLCP